MISRLLSVLVLGALFASPLYAVTVDGLFSAAVPVADRSSAETERGVGEAFNEVIVKDAFCEPYQLYRCLRSHYVKSAVRQWYVIAC
jgi:hypothetical protein